MSYKNMIDNIQKYLKDGLKDIGAPRKDQERMVKAIINDLVTKDDEFPTVAKGIEAPNGAGKSAVIAATAMAFAKENRRVLVLEPNYKLIEDIQYYTLKFDVENVQIKPFNEFNNVICEIKPGELPNRRLCQNWKKKCINTNCEVMKHFAKVSNELIVFSTHHKIIYDQSLLRSEIVGKFDLIIIDEFHMIPETIDGFLETSFGPSDIKALLSKVGDNGLKEEINGLLSEYEGISEFEEKKKIMSEINEVFEENEMTKELFTVSRLRPRSGGLFSRREIRPLTLNQTQMLLFSATSIDVKDLLYEQLKFDGITVLPLQQFYQSSEERLKRITIVSVTDLPRLSAKERQSGEASTIGVTIDYLTEVLMDSYQLGIFEKHSIMVLCTANRDANQIKERINNTPLREYIVDIDAIEQEVRADLGFDVARIATEVGKRVANLTETEEKLILVTGSSVFWQGVNLNNVKFIFILNLPYRIPKASEVGRRHKGSWTTSRMFSDMVRRLSQGVGRLCRYEYLEKVAGDTKKRNWGIAIILDGRFITLKAGIKKAFPYVYSSSFVEYDRKRLKVGLKNITKFVKEYDSPYSPDGQLNLKEFFGD
jgi:Rad3-related DNA helicase